MLNPGNGGDTWHYVDLSGTVQGPFATSDMTTWLIAGSFPPGLSVRRVGSHTFVPIEQSQLCLAPDSPRVSLHKVPELRSFTQIWQDLSPGPNVDLTQL